MQAGETAGKAKARFVDATDWIGQGQQATDAFQQALMQRAGGAQYQSAENPNTSLQQLLGAAGNSGGMSGANSGSNPSFSTTPDQTAIQGTNSQDSSLVNALVAALQGQNGANAASLFSNQSNAGSGFFGTGSGGLFGGDNGTTNGTAAQGTTTAQSTATPSGQPTASPSQGGGGQPTANQTAVAQGMGFTHFDPATQSFTAPNGVSLPLTNSVFNGSAGVSHPEVAAAQQATYAAAHPAPPPNSELINGHLYSVGSQVVNPAAAYQRPQPAPTTYGGIYGALAPNFQQAAQNAANPTPGSQMQSVSNLINTWRGSKGALQTQLQALGASSSFANALLGKGGGGGTPAATPAPAPASHGGAPTVSHGGTNVITSGGTGISGTGFGGSNIGLGGSYVPNITLGGYGGGAGQFGGSGGYNMAYNGGYSGIGGGGSTWTPGSSYSTAGMQALGT